MKKGLVVLAMLSLACNSYGQNAEQFFELGLKKYEGGDKIGAIKDYTKAISFVNSNTK